VLIVDEKDSIAPILSPLTKTVPSDPHPFITGF